MDRRDLLLDKLSEKFGIEIDKENFEGINLSTSNHAKNYQDKTSEFGGAPPIVDGKDANLVQRINPGDVYRFSYIKDMKPAKWEEGTKEVEITYYVGGDIKSEKNKRTLTVNIESEEDFKRLDEERVLWTDNEGKPIIVDKDNIGHVWDGTESISLNKESGLKLFEPPSGEFRGQMSVQQDIDIYKEQLNKLAKALAFSVNAIHTQSNGMDGEAGDGILFFVNGTGGSEEEITAENIAVNKVIKENTMKIIAGVTSNSGEGDGKRALAIAKLKDTLMAIQGIDRNTDRNQFIKDHFDKNEELGGIYTITKNTEGMTMDTYFNDIIGGLGVDEAEAKRMVKNQATVLAGFQQSKDSVSGVSLDEEFANLVQFNHCYQANAKIISTVDQLLDVVINGLKK
jgi:flagellar hook-associated protein 1 FlgK